MTYRSVVQRLCNMLHMWASSDHSLFCTLYRVHRHFRWPFLFCLFSSMYGSSPLSKQPPDDFVRCCSKKWKSDVSAQCSSVAEWGPAVLCFRVTLCGPTFSWILGTAQPCLTPTWAGLRRGLNTSTSLLEYSVSRRWQRTRWVMTPRLSTYTSHVSATVFKLKPC